jgi:WD40 repeat protein
VGEPLDGHANAVTAVATVVLDGRSVVVTSSDDETVRLWDLATGRPVGDPLPVVGAAQALAVTVGPVPVLAAAGYGITVVRLASAADRR